MATKPASHPLESGYPENDWNKYQKDVDISEPSLLLLWGQRQIIPGWHESATLMLRTNEHIDQQEGSYFLWVFQPTGA
jgi:hypothetical protein